MNEWRADEDALLQNPLLPLGARSPSWRFQSLVTGLAGLWGGIPQLQKADTRQHGLVAAVAAQAALLGLALSKP